jgi:hypothetical protein
MRGCLLGAARGRTRRAAGGCGCELRRRRNCSSLFAQEAREEGHLAAAAGAEARTGQKKYISRIVPDGGFVCAPRTSLAHRSKSVACVLAAQSGDKTAASGCSTTGSGKGTIAVCFGLRRAGRNIPAPAAKTFAGHCAFCCGVRQNAVGRKQNAQQGQVQVRLLPRQSVVRLLSGGVMSGLVRLPVGGCVARLVVVPGQVASLVSVSGAVLVPSAWRLVCSVSGVGGWLLLAPARPAVSVVASQPSLF